MKFKCNVKPRQLYFPFGFVNIQKWEAKQKEGKKLKHSFRNRTQTPKHRWNSHLQEIYSYSYICAEASKLNLPCLFAGLRTLTPSNSVSVRSQILIPHFHKNNHFQTVVSSWAFCLLPHWMACSVFGERNPKNFNLVEVLWVNFLPTTGNAKLHRCWEWSQEDGGFSEFLTSAVKSFKQINWVSGLWLICTWCR